MKIGRHIIEEGQENFSCVTLDIVDENNRYEVEGRFIKEFNTIENGFNIMLTNGKQTKEEIEKHKKEIKERIEKNKEIAAKKHDNYLKKVERGKEIKEIIENDFGGDEKAFNRWRVREYYKNNREKRIEYAKQYQKEHYIKKRLKKMMKL